MITRIREYRKKDPCRDARKVYIVCEGEHTEISYFSFFQNRSTNLQVIPIPPTEHHSDPTKLMEWAKTDLCKTTNKVLDIDQSQHDSVWFVFDTDDWAENGKIKPLREFCAEKNVGCEYEVWNALQSNPCFEIWLYYHIYKERPQTEEVKKYESFKQFVNKSITGGFNCDKHPVFLEEAICNAKASYQNLGQDVGEFSTEVYKLGQLILAFTKRDLDILKNKLNI